MSPAETNPLPIFLRLGLAAVVLWLAVRLYRRGTKMKDETPQRDSA